ncbi:MAG: helix-turn-helix transcriptional regulator [Spirochaetes bacterium]|nr:helix-turn-helix transcriptional regulator [Spirochaetota bacterium]
MPDKNTGKDGRLYRPIRHAAAFQRIAERVQFSILEHGYGPVYPRWTSDLHRFPVNRLTIVTRGDGAIIEQGKRHVFRRNDMVLNPVNSDFRQVCERMFENVYIHFRLELFPTRDLFDGMGCIIRPLERPADLIRLMQLVTSPRTGDIIRAKAMLLELVCGFIEGDAAGLERNIAVGEKYRDLFREIRANVNARMTTAELASLMRMKERSLVRMFREDTGKTLKAFIRDVLIERAQSRLLFSDAKIKDIAREIGFSDELYFSRFFKKNAGHSPAAYRAFHRERRNEA